jgi:hypothetical protein
MTPGLCNLTDFQNHLILSAVDFNRALARQIDPSIGELDQGPLMKGFFLRALGIPIDLPGD